MGEGKWGRRYRALHSECGGTLTSVDEPHIGPVLFCSCQADGPIIVELNLED